VVASAFDLLIINRYNIAWGIPDKWFYMFGDAVIGPAVMMFAFMPAVVLTSKLVPKGLGAQFTCSLLALLSLLMFAFMPAVVLTSKLVPKGLGAQCTCFTFAKVQTLTQKALPESTTYALLAGFSSLALLFQKYKY
jgi:hypothetical protein